MIILKKKAIHYLGSSKQNTGRISTKESVGNLRIFLFYLLIIVYEAHYILKIGILTQIIKASVLFLCTAYCIFGIKTEAFSRHRTDLYLLFLYLLTVFLSATLSISPSYVLINGMMLLSLMVFLLDFSQRIDQDDSYRTLRFICIIFSVEVFISIAGYFINAPGFAYTDVWGNRRVNGLFGEPSKLAQLGALNIILVYSFVKSSLVKVPLICISLLGMYLAGNRSYMLTILFILPIIIFIRLRIGKIAKIFHISSLVILVVFFFVLFDQSIILKSVSNSKFLRIESLSTLSGRTTMWESAIPNAMKKPFGSGFLLGGTSLAEGLAGESATEKQASQFDMLNTRGAFKTTLHNGYIQALCDLGFLGSLLYLIIFAKGVVYSFNCLKMFKMTPFLLLFTFFAIVNLSATILVGPTEINTLLFWLSWYMLMINHKKQSRSTTIGI